VITAEALLMQRYRARPDFFVEHALGHKTWSKQREVLRSVRDHVRTAVRASHGVSKTYTAAEAAVWFLNCVPRSKVITTAPTFMQVAKLLWAEINTIYTTSRIQLEGECLAVEIKTKHPDHFAVGFSTDKPARAEGWHSQSIMFILDEGKGIAQWMWDSVRGAMTGGFCRLLVLSTTDGVQVEENFYRIFQGEDADSQWNRIHISAFDSPYVTGEKFRSVKIPDPRRPERFEVEWTEPKDVKIQIADQGYIDAAKLDWGEDSVLYRTKVLGEIVDDAADSIITVAQTNRMFANASAPAFIDAGALQAGIDVARGGTDDAVFFRSKGLRVTGSKVIPPQRVPDKAKLVFIADEFERFIDHDKAYRVKVDDTGVGGGVTDILQDRGYAVAPVNNGGEPSQPDRYNNVAAEMWYEVGKLVHEIACPDLPRLAGELTGRKSASLDSKGRLRVESKDDYKKRSGGKSPDMADAFLLCFYNGVSREPHIWRA